MLEIAWRAGTVEVRGVAGDSELARSAGLRWDARAACHRAPGAAYGALLAILKERGVAFTDAARGDRALSADLHLRCAPRAYQTEALEAWWSRGGRGVVVLPTGAGKSLVALLAIARAGRSALVVAPTLDLVQQWHALLSTSFGEEVGVVATGENTVHALTVTTYDSARTRGGYLGARFGTVVFDECHHLPSEGRAEAALMYLAPHRLGLTATPERTDGLEDRLPDLVGPIVYEKTPADLAGDHLAPWEHHLVLVELDAEERAAYEHARGVYLAFVRRHRVRMNGPAGFGRFMQLAGRATDGPEALAAYVRQRALARGAGAKLARVEELLSRHVRDRALIFTDDNAAALEISRRCLIPSITQHTRVKERREILAAFSAGEIGAVVSARVLNEGVDVPSANVGIIVSGTGTRVEQIQRLGRLLRPSPDKRARLYELVARDTSEMSTSRRRREPLAAS